MEDFSFILVFGFLPVLKVGVFMRHYNLKNEERSGVVINKSSIL